ncbi:MAG TPA: sorbitol dehydrogenase [Lactobacillus sp.]|nr:sorbitol dehydrogenase [Lactobacillus sp.]
MRSVAVFDDHHVEVVEIPKPDYGPYECLVKVESCGICGTDMKLLHGNLKGFDTYPAILGHEGVGRVVEVGRKVTNFVEGDLVMLPFLNVAPKGYANGWGALSEYNVISDAEAKIKDGVEPDESDWGQRKIPNDFDPVNSAMIVTFREVLSQIKTMGFQANQSLFIQGCGPVGLCFLRLSKLLGLGPIIVSDLDDKKLAFAKKLGADHTINAKNENVIEAVRRYAPEGVDQALDAVGLNSFINQAMHLIKDHGSIDVYGISPELHTEINWADAPYNWKLQFSQWPSKKLEGEATQQIVSWIQMGVLDPKDFISDVYPLEKTGDALAAIEAHKPGLKKTVIRID